MKLDEHIREQFRREGAKGGKKAAKMFTPEQRRERARKAIAARWAKKQG
jgi:hypothetical protein